MPGDTISLVGWVVWFGLLLFSVVRNREKTFIFDRRSIVWLAVLSILVILLTPFMGLPIDSGAVHLMVFAAVPWMLAGGVLGLIPAVLMAGFGGVLLAYLDTHSIFTPLIFMTAALVFTHAARQRYRSWIFRALRLPLFSAIAAGLVLIPATYLALMLDHTGSLTLRAVEALGSFRDAYFALTGMVLVGGLICTFAKFMMGKRWGGTGELQPGPAETSLRVRFGWIWLGVSLILLTLGLILQWRAVEVEARRAIVQQMTETSDLVADGLSSLVAAGQETILVMAEDNRLDQLDSNTLPQALGSLAGSFPFFDELTFITPDGQVIAATPAENISTFILSEADLLILGEILSGSAAEPQVLTTSGRISFLVGVKNAEESVQGILWGRNALDSHQFVRPYLSTLIQLADVDGFGQVIGSDGLILYHTDELQIWGQYGGLTFTTPTFFEGDEVFTGRVLRFFQPVNGIGLAVVTEVPVAAIQTAVMEKVLPVLLGGVGLILVGLVVGNVFLARVKRDIQTIEAAAEKVTLGENNPALAKRRFNGEIARLAEAFQKMLVTMRSRMQTQSELLSVSERITGQLKLHDSLQVVLLAALEHGVSSARIVLLGDSQKKGTITSSQQFGLGTHTQAMAALDEDVLLLSQSRGQFVMKDSQISRHFHLGKGMPYQGLMLAMPLSWKNLPLGAFWVTFDDRTTFSEDSFTYFSDLAQKAATAIINTKAFDESLTTRKRYESILANLSDPVLLADEKGAVFYINEAAKNLPGLGNQKGIGAPLVSLLLDEDLQVWVNSQIDEIQSKEISTPIGKTYQASISPIVVDGRRVGTAGIFRDISQFKQRDELKTEFVNLVSHELRSPLILVQGYAKILRQSGNLNKQQENFISNMINSLEGMKALVQDLLALGRLEGGASLVLDEVSVREIIQKVVGLMTPHANQKQIEVKLDLPEESIYFEADSALLVQAISNMMDNAIRCSEKESSVLVSVRKQEDWVVFVVQDDGPGIAPLDQRKIFNPFFRQKGQNDLASDTGDGLGLAIVKSIAERHSGEVWFDSKLGQGSTFYLQIPIVQPR